MKTRGPLDIINTILLDGMRVVGELFGSGQMQLPFVLQSAETMKAAVRYLEPFMPKADFGKHKGKMVLATVKGDVHDIGKNLVDIILTNNGFKVVNLGIKMPIDDILKAAESEKADAIGMSGLLVKSTAVMRDNLEEMNRRGVKTPVILGGAALTRRFVEEDLRDAYKGYVFYGMDAFSGLRIMDELTNPAMEKKLTIYETRGGSGQTNKAGEPRPSRALRPSLFRPNATSPFPSRRSGAAGWRAASPLKKFLITSMKRRFSKCAGDSRAGKRAPKTIKSSWMKQFSRSSKNGKTIV